MCPQIHELNDGAWKTLEQKERIWAQRDSCLIIVSGPIYAKSDKEYIGNIGVRVPSSFFKVIIAPYLDKPRGIGFVYPNMRAPGNMQNYSMTIDEVEKITGYDFFYALPDELENEIESKTSFKEWNKQ
jgi:endonuclease G